MATSWSRTWYLLWKIEKLPKGTFPANLLVARLPGTESEGERRSIRCFHFFPFFFSP